MAEPVEQPVDPASRGAPSALDRAQTYAAIFLHAGDRWRDYVPVDAAVTGDVVHLQGVRMERSARGWRLETNGESWIVLAKGTDRG